MCFLSLLFVIFMPLQVGGPGDGPIDPIAEFKCFKVKKEKCGAGEDELKNCGDHKCELHHGVRRCETSQGKKYANEKYDKKVPASPAIGAPELEPAPGAGVNCVVVINCDLTGPCDDDGNCQASDDLPGGDDFRNFLNPVVGPCF